VSHLTYRTVTKDGHHRAVIEAWTADEIRAAEKPLLDVGTPLMDRAARALARTVLDGLGILAQFRSVVGADRLHRLRSGTLTRIDDGISVPCNILLAMPDHPGVHQ
jgi:hypothetical protein